MEIMKKIILILISSLGVCFISCSKDDSSRLEYTAWEGTNDNGTKRMIAFKPNWKCIDYFYVKVDGGYIDYSLSYSLNGDKVTLIQATGEYASGIISGETMTMDYGYDGGIWVLYKR